MIDKHKFFHKTIFLTITLVLVTWLVASGKVLASSPTVFINEIHYDNSSTDAGKAIEVAGPAGTDRLLTTRLLKTRLNSLSIICKYFLNEVKIQSSI